MSFESDVFKALRDLVPKQKDGKFSVWQDFLPEDVTWPAIRFSITSATPDATVCGSGGDPETEIRVQFDAVSRNPDERDALRVAIMGALQNFVVPNVCEDWDKSYDASAKCFRARLDFLFEPSSAGEVDDDYWTGDYSVPGYV